MPLLTSKIEFSKSRARYGAMNITSGTIAAVVILIIFVQIIQTIGNYFARRARRS